MHALVTLVLLLASWLDAFEREAEPQLPDGERGEPEERPAAREEYPVIGSDGFKYAVLTGRAV